MENKNINSITSSKLKPVILSGGSGKRLWPLSRSNYPKQYLNIEQKNNFSLLQNTYLRLRGLKNLDNPIIISNQEHRFIVAEQMREINVHAHSIILEPSGRNTAPAIALASIKALEKGDDPTLIILSSDHKIEDDEIFTKAIHEGILHAENGRLVTFGISPDAPETGYGYIESFDELSQVKTSSRIKRFIEKPNIEIAKRLFKNKYYLWNSGIFLFKASKYLEELEKYEPEILKTCEKSIKLGRSDLDFFRIDEKVFKKCPNKPVDIAVMEKTTLGTVVKLEAGWDDIGSWDSLCENSTKDKHGNTFQGKIINKNSRNCYFRSEADRLILGINLRDLIIVDTVDAILISEKNSTKELKKLVEKLEKENFSEFQDNQKSYRPWGSFINIEKGPSWRVKKLEIKPKCSISLQLHNHRSEHWIIVAGRAKVEVDKKISFLNKNESIYIPMRSKHRLTNACDSLLILIEVQSGHYLEEDDIIRFEDNFGRANK